jgi:D-arabinan exo alpha-(1,3)/(1,5)-arabinofuranosidase (non-reducing end)
VLKNRRVYASRFLLKRSEWWESIGVSEPAKKLRMITSLGLMRGLAPADCENIADKSLVVAPGEVRRLCDLEGPGRIVRIWFTTPLIGQRHILRDVVWRMYWDGEEEPSVECPLGDLFGAAFGRPHRLVSDRLIVAGGAYVCRFEMPFRSRAVVEIHNQSSKPLRNFFFQISFYREASAPAELATFHAQWRRENPTAPTRPFSILHARGKGHYVGVKLDMQNRSWWLKPPLPHIVIPRGFGIGLLEGWESVRVDEETSPGIVGTGGEDYFGGGFYFTGGAFSTPTHGAMVRSYLTGRVAAYRLHIDDPVPFEESIDVTMDHGFRNQMVGDYSCVAYWYQQEPHLAFPELPASAERRSKFPWTNPVQFLILALVVLTVTAGMGLLLWTWIQNP